MRDIRKNYMVKPIINSDILKTNVRERCLAAGVIAFLEKPYKMNAIDAALEKVFVK